MATTTPELLRDHLIALIGALVPRQQSDLPFAKYRNEGAADFTEWAQDNPTACTRRFQVRDTGARPPPTVTNTDVYDQVVTFEILIAYEQSHRAGDDGALDRDDLAGADTDLILGAIGVDGYANFAGANPNASWTAGDAIRVQGAGVDFVVITQAMRIYRAR